MKKLAILTLLLVISPLSLSAGDNLEVAGVQNALPSTAQDMSAARVLGMVTGSPTGTYFRFGHDIKEAIKNAGIDISVKESTGSIDNINRVGSSENAAFGIVQSDVLGFLRRSSEPESRKLAENLRMVFPFYQEEVHILASKEIKQFSDLHGKRVVVGAKGSGSWLTSVNLFNIMETRPARLLRLSPEEGMVAVLNGKADAMVFVAGKPVKLFKNLDGLAKHENYKDLLKKVHLLPIKSAKILKEYSATTITSADYSFVTRDVPTVAVTAVLMSYDFSDAESEYAKARCANIHDFSRAVSNNIRGLKDSGHPKWKEVNLDAGVGIWKKDKCAISDNPSAVLEDELLNALKIGW